MTNLFSPKGSLTSARNRKHTMQLYETRSENATATAPAALVEAR
jgi:hypothetical protein